MSRASLLTGLENPESGFLKTAAPTLIFGYFRIKKAPSDAEVRCEFCSPSRAFSAPNSRPLSQTFSAESRSFVNQYSFFYRDLVSWLPHKLSSLLSVPRWRHDAPPIDLTEIISVKFKTRSAPVFPRTTFSLRSRQHPFSRTFRPSFVKRWPPKICSNCVGLSYSVARSTFDFVVRTAS